MPRLRTLIAIAAAVCCAATLAAGEAAAQPRIVDSQAQVRSAKRGLCANELSQADIAALSPGVAWWYNWHFDPKVQAPAGSDMEYLPMVWGDDQACLAGVEALLASGARPRRILAMNEPNLKGQAFLTPEAAARMLARVHELGRKYGITVVAPQMALGSPPADSITALDPIEGKQVTYTYMVPYLNALLHLAGAGAPVELGVHCYGNQGELSWLIGMMGTAYRGKPVWVTEFNLDGGTDPAVVREHLIQAIDLLERAPHVAGYAWFKERLGPQSLLAASGQLTALGRTYLEMPVYDPDLYYRVPGRLEAERHLRRSGFDLRTTRDADGFLDLQASGPFAWMDFNIAVPRAGEYVVSARIGGETAGEIQLESGDTAIGAIPCPAGEWREMACIVPLAAGTQRLRLRATRGVTVNWIRIQDR